jgi:adenosine deaminase
LKKNNEFLLQIIKIYKNNFGILEKLAIVLQRLSSFENLKGFLFN